MQPLDTLIDAAELRAGLLAGVVALAVGAVVVLAVTGATRSGRGAARRGVAPIGIVGPAVVVATLGALAGWSSAARVVSIPGEVVLGLVVLWAAGEVGARTRRSVGAALGLLGGAALAAAATGPAWVVLLLGAGPAVAGTAAADLDRRGARHGLGPILFLVAVGGLYLCVPDTELVLVLLGVAVPLTLLAFPWVVGRLGDGGAVAAVGLFLWITTVDGAGRAGSIVGGAAALGLLVAEPLGHATRRLGSVRRLPGSASPRPSTNTRGRADGGSAALVLVVVGAQVLLALYAARVAGRADDAAIALLLSVPALVAGAAMGAATAGRLEEHD